MSPFNVMDPSTRRGGKEMQTTEIRARVTRTTPCPGARDLLSSVFSVGTLIGGIDVLLALILINSAENACIALGM
jgi:hypothetical protein